MKNQGAQWFNLTLDGLPIFAFCFGGEIGLQTIVNIFIDENTCFSPREFVCGCFAIETKCVHSRFGCMSQVLRICVRLFLTTVACVQKMRYTLFTSHNLSCSRPLCLYKTKFTLYILIYWLLGVVLEAPFGKTFLSSLPTNTAVSDILYTLIERSYSEVDILSPQRTKFHLNLKHQTWPWISLMWAHRRIRNTMIRINFALK